MVGNSNDLIPIRRSTLDAIERALDGWGLDILLDELRVEIRLHDRQPQGSVNQLLEDEPR